MTALSAKALEYQTEDYKIDIFPIDDPVRHGWTIPAYAIINKTTGIREGLVDSLPLALARLPGYQQALELAVAQVVDGKPAPEGAKTIDVPRLN